MPFKSLFLDESGNPAFKQPVPLRLLPAITNWTARDLLSLIGHGIEQKEKTIFIIKCYVYDGTESPKTKHRVFYRDLLSSDAGTTVEILPSNHFVWSDDLVLAFSEFIDLTCGREDAQNSGTYLNWSPDVVAIQQELQDCPDFDMLSPKDKPEISRTQRLYASWCAHRQKLIDSGEQKYQHKTGIPNELQIAKEINKTAAASVDHIRDMIRKHCQK